MPRKEDDHRIAVGGPLHLAEARYFQHELRTLGVAARIRADASLGSRRDRVHVVQVLPDDAETAELARRTILDEDGDGERDGPDNDPPRQRKKTPLLLGVLGLLTGWRVGASLSSSPWSGALLAGALAFVAYGAARIAEGAGFSPPVVWMA